MFQRTYTHEEEYTLTGGRCWLSVTGRGLESPRPGRMPCLPHSPVLAESSFPLLPSNKLFHISQILHILFPLRTVPFIPFLSKDLTHPPRHKSVTIFTVKFSPITLLTFNWEELIIPCSVFFVYLSIMNTILHYHVIVHLCVPSQLDHEIPKEIPFPSIYYCSEYIGGVQ